MFIHYDSAGAILFTFEGDEASNRLNGSRFIESPAGVTDITHYVDLSGTEPVVLEKRPLDTSHTVAGLQVYFTALPAGVTLRVGEQEMVTDGDDVIEFEIPGTYTIELSGLVEYLDETLEVTIG